MELSLSGLNWIAILACVVLGQVFLTLWFTAHLGEHWAKAYGAANRAQHTKEVPVCTYAIQLGCMVLPAMGLAMLQRVLGIAGFGADLQIGLLVALSFALATALPGYAFLRRWDAGKLAISSQFALILILSVILAVWQ